MKAGEFYNQFHNWVLTQSPKYVFGVIILLIGLWLIRFLRSRLKQRMSRRKVHSSLQPFILSLTITILYVLLVISVMNIIGFELTIFTTIIGAFSVAAGLALSGTFQNFAGGVLILLLKPFEVDDNIVAQGQDGIVTSIQIFYTVLLTPDNKTVIIPNGKLFNEVIVNVSREGIRRLDLEIKLAYVADTLKVENAIHRAIESTQGILTTQPTRVGIVAMEVDGIRFTVNVWVNPNDFLNIKVALYEHIMKAFTADGIRLPGM